MQYKSFHQTSGNLQSLAAAEIPAFDFLYSTADGRQLILLFGHSLYCSLVPFWWEPRVTRLGVVTESIMLWTGGWLGQDRTDDFNHQNMGYFLPAWGKQRTWEMKWKRLGRSSARGGDRHELSQLFALSQIKLLGQGIISSTMRHNLLTSTYERIEKTVVWVSKFSLQQGNGMACLCFSWFLWSITN